MEEYIGSDYKNPRIQGFTATVSGHYTTRNLAENNKYLVDGTNIFKDEWVRKVIDDKDSRYEMNLEVDLLNYFGAVEGGIITIELVADPAFYIVTFNSNGGQFSGKKEVKLSHGQKVKMPTDPVREGYVFLHWAIDTEDGAPFDFSEPYNKDVKLVAKYELDGVKVTLDMGEGSVYVDNKYVNGSHTLIFPENSQFEPTNYQFYLKGKTIDYWVDEAGNKVAFPVTLSKNVTFRAVYRDITDTNSQRFKHFTRLENQNDTDKVEVVGTTHRTSRTVTSDPASTEEQYTTEIDNRVLAKALGLPAVEVVDIIVFLDGYDKFSDEPRGLIAEKVKADYNQANGKSIVVYKTSMSSDEGQVEGGKVVVVVKEKKLYTLTIDPNGGKIQPQFIRYKVEAGKTFSGFNGILKPTLRGKQFERWVLPDGTTFNIGTYVFNSDVTITAEYKDLPINNGAGFVVQAKIGKDTIIPLQDVVVTSRVVFFKGNLEKAIINTKIDEESLARALGDKYELVRINSIDVVAKGHFANKDSWPLNQGYMESDLEKFQKHLVEVIAFNHGRWVDALTVKVQLMKDIGQVEGGTIELNLEVKNKYKVSFIDFGGKTPNGEQEFTVVDGGTIKDEVFKPTRVGDTFVKWVVDGADYDPKNDPVTKHITPEAVYEKLPEHNGYGFEVLVKFVDAKGETRTKAMKNHLVFNQTSTVGDMTSQRYSVRTNHKDIAKALGSEYNLLEVTNIEHTVNGYKFNKDSSQSATNPLTSEIKDIYLEEKNVAATVVTEHHKDFGQVEGGIFVIQVVVEAAKPKHVIWFKVDDDVVFEDVRKRTVEEGKKLAEPTYIPLKKGYRFLGWYKESATDAYDFDAEVNEAFNLFAKFEKIENLGKLAVKVKYNDGTKDVTVDLPGVLVSPKVRDKGRNAEYVYQLELPYTEISSVVAQEFAFERVSGKEFVISGVKNAKSKGTSTVLVPHDSGWPLNSDGKAGVKLTVEINKDYGQVEGGVITFVIKVQRKHTVTLDAGGGTFKGDLTYTIASGTIFAKPEFDPYKKGHKFLGWYNGTELYDFKEPVTQDLNLVARYVRIEDQKNLGYEVILVLPNGEELPMDGSIVTRMGQKPDAIHMTHIYSVVSTMDEIKKVLGEKNLELLDILQYEIEAVSQHYREPQTIQEAVDSWNVKKIQMSSDKLSYTFSVTLPVSHDVLGGKVKIKVDAAEVGKPKHTVTFNPNGGKYAGPTEIVVRDGGKLEEPAFTPKRNGYKFIGWFKKGVKYDFAQAITESFELVAQFEEIPVNPNTKHFVTFDPNGGVYYGLKEVQIPDGGTVGVPADTPVRTGYTFLYWAMWKEDGEKFDFTAPIRESVVLVAAYEEKPVVTYNVTFDPNGGILDGSTDERVVVVNEKTAVQAPNVPTKENHKFLHWAVGIETGEKYVFTTLVTADLKLVAFYEVVSPAPVVKHKVTFDPNGGVYFGLTKVMIPDGGTVNVPADEPVKTGHKFLYWTLEGETTAYDFDTAITQDITLVAMYDKLPEVKHTVTFDPNGGTLDGSADAKTVEVVDNTAVAEPSTPVMVGHKFLHWAVGIETGEKYEFTTFVTGDLKLVAVYEVILPAPVVKHKVTFDPNGGVYFGLTKVMILDGGTVNVPADEPVKTGHKFLHWALVGETAAYDFDTPITQDITLVAVYESLNPAPINKFIVTFDPNGGMLNGSTAPVGVEVEENQKVVEPTNPMKDGHKFIEWRKDGAAYDFDSPVTESFTLVAYYEKENTGGNDGGNTGGNTGGNDNTGGNTGGNDNAGGNTGTGNNQGTTDSGVDFFPDTTTGSTGGTTGTVEIEEEETPLSNVEKTDDVLMNGEKTSLKIGKDGTIVVTEADLKDVKDPILMSFKLENGDHTYVTFQKEGEKNIVIPISVYLDGRMHVVIAGPGTYVAKEAPASFRGVPEKHWGMRFIQIVGARQLMVGNEHGDFMPDVPTTRAMFTQILARLQKVDLTSVQSNHYADVPMDKWYAASVNWATDQGIVNGVGGGKFAPEDPITREQMAVMIYHYLKRNNWKLIMKAGATQFTDHELVSGWAKDAVTELKDYGIFEGNPGHKFDPKANATRAEVATVVARLLELYIKSLMMK